MPVAGPFLSATLIREVYWSLPWAIVDGLAQVSGLTLTILGARDKRKVPVLLESLSVGPMVTPGGDGRGLVVGGRF